VARVSGWNRRRTTRLVGLVLVLASIFGVFSWGVAASSAPVSESLRAGTYNAFTAPQMVTIRGYSGSAMEPFISEDGQYLLFNTSNVAPSIPTLEFASRVDADTFQYQGEIEGTNQSGYLSGTPSMDDDGNLYFVSTRSYSQTLSTIYSGSFVSGVVTGVRLVPGISGGTLGTIDFDVDVSSDGSTLYVSVGHFDGGPPTSASLIIFDKVGNGFVPDPQSAKILRAVNEAGMLTYAASISSDGLELFFTRANLAGGDPTIYRAVRTKVGATFGHVQQIRAITGFAEAPAISTDGTTLYYHLLVGNTFQIWTVTRR
jgi:WD40-like Beta Propeller Repeat